MEHPGAFTYNPCSALVAQYNICVDISPAYFSKMEDCFRTQMELLWGIAYHLSSSGIMLALWRYLPYGTRALSSVVAYTFLVSTMGFCAASAATQTGACAHNQ